MALSKDGGKPIKNPLSNKAPVGPKLNRTVHGNAQVKPAGGNTSGGPGSSKPCCHGNSGSQRKG